MSRNTPFPHRPKPVELLTWRVYALRESGTWVEFTVQAKNEDDANWLAIEEMDIRCEYDTYRDWWVARKVAPADPGIAPKRIVIYGGTVFEVEDPFHRTQNIVATKQGVVTVAPGQSQAVEIDTWPVPRPRTNPKVGKTWQ